MATEQANEAQDAGYQPRWTHELPKEELNDLWMLWYGFDEEDLAELLEPPRDEQP